MPEYKCPRCNYNTKQKADMSKHIDKRKTQCPINNLNIDIKVHRDSARAISDIIEKEFKEKEKELIKPTEIDTEELEMNKLLGIE